MVDHDETSKGGSSRRDPASRILRPRWIFRRAIGDRAEHEAGSVHVAAANSGAVDVICCGMYRACSTWQYEVAVHLVETKLAGERLGYLSGEEYQARASTGTDHVRVFKSHDAAAALGRALDQGRAIGLYAYRDLRDVVFSLMHKRGLSFRGLVRQGMIQRILANDRYWRRRPGVLVQRYEDLLSEPAAGVEAIAGRLGIELEPGEAERIAGEYSREANRSRTRALAHRLHEAGVDLQSASSAQICDPGTLLHWNHLREAGDGAWRVLATPRQLAILDRMCGKWLEEHGYARERGSTAIDSRERIKDECDLAIGWARFVMGSMAARLPGAARFLKKVLRVSDAAGATNWTEGPGRGRSRQDAGTAVGRD